MAESATASKTAGFLIGHFYQFNPLVTAVANLSSGREDWIEKTFAEGCCLADKGQYYLFQGTPVGETAEYFFFVDAERGNAPHELLHPTLRAQEKPKVS